jgi:HEAT repeat protein
LDEPTQSISSRALIALTYIGEPAIPALAEALNHPNVDHVAMSAAAMLGSMGEVALPTLMERIDDNNVNVREAVALGLSGLGDLAIDVLRKMLEDPSHTVRRQAIETLRRIGTPDALKVLREMRNYP